MDNPRQVATLAAGYGLSLTSIALVISAAPLVGAALAPERGLATLPVTLQILGTMFASLPASLLMGRFGRRNGFLLGTGIGAAGAVTATYAILAGSFWLFCLGSMFIGMLNGFGQFYRFAAADVAGADKARAISWVMVGGLLAGILGPGLAAGTENLATARFAGSYASILLLYAIIVVMLLPLKIPRPTTVDGPPPRTLGTIFSQPAVLVAVLAAMLAYGAMVLVMTATPLSMQAAGHSFGTSAMVIQAHVLAMFAPSFFTGRLILRFGVHRVMAAGAVALLVQPLVALQGLGFGYFTASLILLGVGWNFLFVGGTTLLTTLHRPSETAKVQGVNDLLVFTTAAAGSFLAGRLQADIGWGAMNAALLPILIVAMGMLVACGWLANRVAPAGVPG